MGLRDIGNKTTESIDNLDPATIGDIVSDIEATIIEIRGEVPEDDNKVDHLYRLFCQLTRGEPYEGKLETEEDEEVMTFRSTSGVIASGMMKNYWGAQGHAPIAHSPASLQPIVPMQPPDFFVNKNPTEDTTDTDAAIKEPVVNTVKNKRWSLPKIELRWW